MAERNGFTIEVTSSYPGFWRYNMALMCGCFDTQGVRTDFCKAEDTIADVGTNLTAKPEGYPARRAAVLATAPADHLLLYVYIIPHTLPTDRDIASTKPFQIQLRILSGDREVTKETYRINQWSGASIELKVTQEGVVSSATAEK